MKYLMAAIVICALAGAKAGANDTDEARTIEVIGIGTVEVPPDYLTINSRVAEQGRLTEKRVQSLEARVDSIREFILSLGDTGAVMEVGRLDERDDLNGHDTIREYWSFAPFTIELRDFAHYERVLEGLRRLNVQFPITVSPHLTDDSPSWDSALVLALADATAQARRSADATAMVLGPPIRVLLDVSPSEADSRRRLWERRLASPGPTTIVINNLEGEDSPQFSRVAQRFVKVVFELKRP